MVHGAWAVQGTAAGLEHCLENKLIITSSGFSSHLHALQKLQASAHQYHPLSVRSQD